MMRMFSLAALTAVTVIAGTAAASAGEYGPGGYGYGGQVTSNYAYRDSYAWAPAPVYEEGYVAVAPGPYYGPGWGAGYNGTNHPTPSSTQGDVGPGGNNNGTRSGYYRW
ncbi:hypothetical protein [Bradyrhizobium sp. HKCCYLR20261]|uniref:hypothetical protein n=1 Tax=Bradyrhizobium sp. HKCCYLR20261 TaxID=3420760 RepID=UPI003EB837E6